MRRALAFLMLVAACSRPPPPSTRTDAGVPQVDPPGYYMGRRMAEPMSWHGADWLDRPNRDEVQRPEHVLDVLRVREGQTVADVGCGSGYFTVHLAKRVGARGRVYATDLQQEMLDLLAKKVAAASLGNVTPIRATADDAKLPPRALDLILLVDVYHELPNPPATLAQFKSALAPGGVLALVEYRAEDPKVAIKPEHKTTLEQLRRELAANHWTFLASDESLPEQRIVTFRPE
ncbi:MAG: class I SAM-dependent methyltransferase [Labilithrix sp.]|nr:class I SAM-dependent methyltransferase [Labilithrix sp.]